MPSNVAKGAYYKARTKKWLEAQGYAVAHMERVHWIVGGKSGRFPIKKDQFGSDLLAMGNSALLFVQVKFGSPDQPKSVANFKAYPFPKSPTVRVVIVAWKLRDRVPQVIDVTEEVVAA